MNSLVFLPLLAAASVAAPMEGYEVKAHVPAGVELHAVGHAVAVAPAVVPAVPGYSVDGEVRQVTHTLPEPEKVAVDVNSLPVLAAPAPYAAPYTVPHAPVPYALPHASVQVPVAPAPITYSNVNLNVPAPVPAGDAPAPEELVQHIPVKALGRPDVTYTPQVTEVRPELKIYEKTYDVAVPKPVYQTQHVTPVHHKYVAKPYAVPQPYPVPQPYAVPQPYVVPQPYAAAHPYAVPAVQPAYGAVAVAEH